MSKEIYISSTPHETRLAVVENDALTEIYYERENEYTLAGSIYNGRVTRVLPGMQSSFVDIGLERDAFLYITDFMEEAPDSAEFDTSSASDAPARESRTVRPETQNSVPRLEASAPAGQGPREPRADRGDRNDRGRRGRGGERGGRPERSPQVERPASPELSVPSDGYAGEMHLGTPMEIPASYAPESGYPAGGEGELGEGAPGADGTRRWRGRRGRRRGRGPVVGGALAPAEGLSQTHSAGTELTTEVAVPDERTAVYEEPLAGAVQQEPSVSRSVTPSEPSRDGGTGSNQARRDAGRERGGRDGRNDRGRGDRGGREDRGRSERPARIPRGFAPSTSLYGVESPELESEPSEPIILPGESLSKYRSGGEPVTEKEATSTLSAAPSPGFTIQAGWDGGYILPGESLSRHRRNDSAPRAQASQRPPAAVAPMIKTALPASPIEVVQELDGPSVAVTPETQPEVALSGHPEQIPSAEIAHEDSGPASTLESQEIETEYEPSEGSASFRVDTDAPREYRHSAPVPLEEQPTAAAGSLDGTTFGHTHLLTPEPAISAPTGGTADLSSVIGEVYEFDPLPLPSTSDAVHDPVAAHHEVTTVWATGEMLSPTIAEELPNASPLPADDQLMEGSAGKWTEPTVWEIVPRPLHHEEANPVSGVTPLNLIAEPSEEFEESEELDSQTFAPGSGELEEELMDDDEFEIAALHAGYEDDMEDLEEETLEGAADLGTMIREMSIDQITRVTLPIGELEEDTEEDFIEESALLDEPDDEESEEHARTAEATGDFSEEFREPASSDRGASPEESRRQPRDVRRGSRDRDRRGGDSSGRPRNTGGSGDRDRGRSSSRPSRGSMQTTNLPAISDLLKPGQEILVQIAKEPIAKKGARITSHIALPGRFLVFMPTVNHTGVSRKIESDGERRRLKEILLSEKGEAAGGFIVRTAAAGATEEELRSDLRFLLNLWADIKNRSESSKSPALIYHDLNLVERILRDQVTDNFSAIWVDTETEYERVLRFLQRFQPGLIRRVKLYLKETPLFEQFGITEEINKALRSKVWLKSGGSIVINQTEALVAIDINTGKFVGKTARLEDTIVKTNLDAIPEIVRQIRLRDLGGIIIIDFIDMDERKNRNRVMAALEDELKSDRAPSKVLQFNDFGLVAITRKRVKQSLERTLSTTCNVCVGTGMVKSPVTVCNDIYIEMRKMYKHLDKGDLMLRVNPEVVKQLKSSGTRWLQEMEEMTGKTILVKSDPALHPEQFDIH